MTSNGEHPGQTKPPSTDEAQQNVEASYHQAMQAFGIDSAEAKVAWSFWNAARRKARTTTAASKAPA